MADGKRKTTCHILHRFARRCAPTKLAIYPSDNAPYSVAFIGESSTISISHLAYARDKSGVASPRFPAHSAH